jgi:hypothetical protein
MANIAGRGRLPARFFQNSFLALIAGLTIGSLIGMVVFSVREGRAIPNIDWLFVGHLVILLAVVARYMFINVSRDPREWFY